MREGGPEGLDEEGPQRLLEGGDGTGDVGEGGLEMGEDLRRGSVLRRQLRRRTSSEECRADLALAVAEAFPDAQQGPVTPLPGEGAEGGEDAVGDGVLEKAPQTVGGQAEASDFVGEPDAERPAAARPSLAVAAKNTSGAESLSVGIAVVKAVPSAVPNQSADHLAVRTGGQLEPFGNRVPFLGVAVKPGRLAHEASSAKSVILPDRGGAG
jgi:hypothetical protein